MASALPHDRNCAPSCRGTTRKVSSGPTSFGEERVTPSLGKSKASPKLPNTAHCHQTSASQAHTVPRDKPAHEPQKRRHTRPHVGFHHANPQTAHFRMIGPEPLRAADKPLKASPNTTSLRAERATQDRSLGTTAGSTRQPETTPRGQASTSTAHILPRDKPTRATFLHAPSTTAP